MWERTIGRRTFVGDVGKLALGAMVVPRAALGGTGHQAPSDTLNIALIGVGGMGLSNAEQLVGENIVALCDVDFGYVERQLASRAKDRDGKPKPEIERVRAAFARATRHADFRRMLERQKDIDAVVIATPDHSHAVIALAAMDAGKHVYVQKPLTYTVRESRLLADAARRTGVVTQMGNQGHSSDEARRINEWIQAGVIGAVREVRVWTNRPIWPQGIPRPTPLASQPTGPRTSWGNRAIAELTAAALAGDYPVPPGLDWDLYLGPAPQQPYHPMYHPFNWRGWVDFGVGALGDMGAHLIDHPYWALELGYPSTVEATSTPFGGPREAPVTYPAAMTAHYEFPARGDRPPVSLDWYDGGLMPPRPAVLPDDVPLNREGGVIFVGEKGILMHETYGKNPRIWPESLMEAAQQVPATLARVGTSHEM
ncbi:MAG TPA: Gfo/Idh/MocA family oxidoreductase, partial [Gemmatimonadaceae bacterium]|nr:Gfo/Idh/MocA family oxidoreductase [Gemmatimonadaceae bacterium]